MRAIIICVDYSDYLSLSLPYNRHHFEEVVIVTSPSDEQTVKIAKDNKARVFQTEAFYEDGADFNKYKALEQGLDFMGRTGWLSIMDADVVWPKSIPEFSRQIGHLYTPLRRMLRTPNASLPQEEDWKDIEYHPCMREFSGYTQIFHASDPVLGQAPWHETNWKHAGGGDTFFQFKWKEENKVRPPFECLHLGEDGTNWCGRATPYIDGTVPTDSQERSTKLREYIRGRHNYAHTADRFAGEKL